MSSIAVTTHNIGPGKPGRAGVKENVQAVIDHEKHPPIVILEEAAEFQGTLKGYGRIAEDEGHPENANTLILVRHDVHILRTPFIHVGGPNWHGPKHGKTHPPKVHPGIVVNYDDHLWAILGVHRMSGKNPPSVEEREWRCFEEWVKARDPHRSVIMEGDWNSTRSSARLRKLARDFDLQISLRSIDGALHRNCELKAFKELKGLYGSDAHEPCTLTFEA